MFPKLFPLRTHKWIGKLFVTLDLGRSIKKILTSEGTLIPNYALMSFLRLLLLTAKAGYKPLMKVNAQIKKIKRSTQRFYKTAFKTGFYFKFSYEDEKVISITIPSKISESKGFDITNLDPNVNFYCLLTYDYHSAHERSANHHSLLFRGKEISDCNEKANLNVNSTVEMYIKKKATMSKLIIGISLFGKCFRLESPWHHKSGSPILGPYSEKPCNQQSIITYSMICELVKNGSWSSRITDSCSVGPYAYGKNINTNTPYWIGYDDEASAQQKGSYVTSMKLGGVSFWALNLDDFRGACSGIKFPFIKATKLGLQSNTFQCRDQEEIDNPDLTSNQIINISQKVRDNTRNVFDHLNANDTSASRISNSDVSYNPFRMASKNIFTGIWGILNLIIGVVGNILTLTSIPRAAKHQRHDLHKNWYSSTIFVLNLALFDLGFCIFGMPQDIFFYLGF